MNFFKWLYAIYEPGTISLWVFFPIYYSFLIVLHEFIKVLPCHPWIIIITYRDQGSVPLRWGHSVAMIPTWCTVYLVWYLPDVLSTSCDTYQVYRLPRVIPTRCTIYLVWYLPGVLSTWCDTYQVYCLPRCPYCQGCPHRPCRWHHITVLKWVRFHEIQTDWSQFELNIFKFCFFFHF